MFFQDLRHFGRLTGGDRNNLVEDGTVERLECPAGSGVVGAKHFRDGSRGEVRVGWVFAFGRVAHEEFVADLQPGLLQDRQHNFGCGARIGGAFQDHKLAGTKVRH